MPLTNTNIHPETLCFYIIHVQFIATPHLLCINKLCVTSLRSLGFPPNIMNYEETGTKANVKYDDTVF